MLAFIPFLISLPLKGTFWEVGRVQWSSAAKEQLQWRLSASDRNSRKLSVCSNVNCTVVILIGSVHSSLCGSYGRNEHFRIFYILLYHSLCPHKLWSNVLEWFNITPNIVNSLFLVTAMFFVLYTLNIGQKIKEWTTRLLLEDHIIKSMCDTRF